MAESKAWSILPYDITYLIFKEISFLDDLNSKASWQSIANCLLVCRSWNEAMRYHLSRTGPLEPLLSYGSEPCALVALQRELSRSVVLVSSEGDYASIGEIKETLQRRGTKRTLDDPDGLSGERGPATEPLEIKTTVHPSEEYPGKERLGYWLRLCTGNCFVRCMRLLLANDAPIIRDIGTRRVPRYEHNLLELAVTKRCVGAVELFLAQSRRVMPRRYADLAIVLAYEIRHVPSIEALFKYGAWRRNLVSAESLDYVEEMRIPPVSYAVEADDKEMVSLLVKYMNSDEDDWEEFPSPMVRAVRRNNLAMTQHLLRIGLSPNPRLKRMPLPLGEAARLGFAEAMDLLIDWGADVNGSDEEGLSPLDYALCDGETRIVDKLLDFDATISEITFRAVVDRGSVRVLRLLLDRLPLTSPSLPSYGLCEAASRGDEEMVRVFLEYGAEMTHRQTSRHALYVAVGQGNTNVIRRLLDYGQSTQSFMPEHGAIALSTAITTQNIPVTELLLSRGANPNVSTLEFTSALHRAIPTGNRGLVRVLLVYGADVHRRSAGGVSIMGAAMSTGSNAIVALIREYGGSTGDEATHMMNHVSDNGAGAQNGE